MAGIVLGISWAIETICNVICIHSSRTSAQVKPINNGSYVPQKVKKNSNNINNNVRMCVVQCL